MKSNVQGHMSDSKCHLPWDSRFSPQIRLMLVKPRYTRSGVMHWRCLPIEVSLLQRQKAKKEKEKKRCSYQRRANAIDGLSPYLWQTRAGDVQEKSAKANTSIESHSPGVDVFKYPELLQIEWKKKKKEYNQFNRSRYPPVLIGKPSDRRRGSPHKTEQGACPCAGHYRSDKGD